MKPFVTFAGLLALLAVMVAYDGGANTAVAGWRHRCHGSRARGCGWHRGSLFGGRAYGGGACHGGTYYAPYNNSCCGTMSYPATTVYRGSSACGCHGSVSYGSPTMSGPGSSGSSASPPPAPPTPPSQPSPSDQPSVSPDANVPPAPPAPDSAATSSAQGDQS